MKISANSGYLIGRYGHEKAFYLLKEAGFDATDVGLGDMTRDESPYNLAGYQEYAQKVRDAADKVGLEINQSHAPFKYPLDIWENRPDLMDILRRSIEISGIFGTKVEIIHPWHHPEFHGHEDEIFEKNMEYYNALIPTAKACGVKIGVENMFQVDPRRRHIVHDTCSKADDFIRYIDTLNSDAIVACLDIGHVGVILRDDEPWDMVRALGHDRLHALHVHDNDYRGDQHLLPYAGKINWQEVTRALGEIDYDGDFTYETGGNQGTMDDLVMPLHLKYMADLARFLTEQIDANRPKK